MPQPDTTSEPSASTAAAPARVPATLAEVARRAGVSTATASRVLSRSAPVSAPVAARVVAAARELSYVRRRAPRGRDTGVVAVVVFADPLRYHADPFHLRLLTGLRQAATGLERELALFNVPERAHRPALLRHLCGGHVDGVLLVGAWEDAELPRLLRAADVPVVSVGRPVRAGTVAYVDVANLTGARLAALRLCESGRRSVATIAGPPGTAVGADRLAGYRQAVTEAGPVVRSVVAYGDFSGASGEHAMLRLLQQRPYLEAVFVASDPMAIGALRALRRLGRRVPEQVAVIGFDDVPAAALARPQLTTVHQPVEQLGARALEMLLERPDRSASLVLPTSLVLRDSAD
ncbi:LacI family DNA-binding transcriptional regulator [Kitasatospora sp. NBC_01266]|uniref:LacI family DNA-binding transcriptional regulator n=1 Tax=Kitasatospora sp. NBC_01266 TaxID=2903572 RepID=UPI002E36AFC1|nr:LacI family DNA-binding transcriptional regulator [Kitasatospora sp. NBC_01266]